MKTASLHAIFASSILILTLTSSSLAADDFYHNYIYITSLFKNLTTQFPTKAHLYSIGKSAQGRELWVLAIADQNADSHQLLRPEAKYIGNMHGNEAPGREILIRFILHLLNNQTNDPDADYLMKNTRIHILPSMNPDGFAKSHVNDCGSTQGRYNANTYDLNRNFPDHFALNTAPIQPESRAVMNWLASNDFVLSANFHTGSYVINYPYDNYKDAGGISKPSICDDDDVFKTMALNYTANNINMRRNQVECTEGDNFINGTTNGASWYPATGTMQDYNYWKHGCMEVTIELGCCLYPDPSKLESIWNENKQALLDYMKFASTGVRGLVKFADGTVAQNLTIQIDSRDPAFKTNSNGEFYRIILPGTYKLSVLIGCSAPIYQTTISVPSIDRQLLELNITLAQSHLADYKAANLDKFGIYCNK